MQCMGALRLGPTAQRWVQLLYSQLTARVRFSGWLSPEFPVDTGLAQGSFLSPLLFVIAAQSLAALLRRQAHRGLFSPISRPDGRPGPPSHQHADDITLHVRTRQNLHAAIESSVLPFCRASGSSLNAGKSVAMLLGEAGEVHQGMDPQTGVRFVERGQSVRHLGIRLSTDPLAAAEET